MLTPAERSLRARLAAHAAVAKYGGAARTEKARAAGPGKVEYWCARVDPEGALSEADRLQRAEAARVAHFLRLSVRASNARRARRATP